MHTGGNALPKAWGSNHFSCSHRAIKTQTKVLYIILVIDSMVSLFHIKQGGALSHVTCMMDRYRGYVQYESKFYDVITVQYMYLRVNIWSVIAICSSVIFL